MADIIENDVLASLTGDGIGFVDMIDYSTKIVAGPVARAIEACFVGFPDDRDPVVLAIAAARTAAAMRALPADHVALVERWITAPEGPGAGLAEQGQDPFEHVLANISTPCVQYDLLAMDEDATHLPGIHALIMDASLDDEARAAAIVAMPDGPAWLDWAVNRGPHPEDGRFFPRWDGDGRYELTERGTWRVLASSKWNRWTSAVADILNAFPDFVEDYAAATAHGRTLAPREANPMLDDVWARMEAATASWRAEHLSFYDPFKPFVPQIAATIDADALELAVPM